MGNKRIYLGRESSKYAKIAGGAIITVTSLFFVLMAMGFEITGSDDICLGTPEDPCISYGKICNLGPDNFDIYNPDEVKMDFSPTVKNYWMFFKDGRVKKQFLYDQGINASTKGWRYENFTDATKPRKDRIYVHRFARYSCQEYMLVGLKEKPEDLIKWGVGVGAEYLDPFWYGEATADTLVSGNISMEIGFPLNFTTNLTGATTTCVNIDHPDYGDNYTCGTPNANFTLNISYFRLTEFYDSGITTWEELAGMNDDLTASYTLGADLDSSSEGYDTYAGPSANGGAGWTPIGTNSNTFTGTFNGQNHTISDIYITKGFIIGVGLFGSIGDGKISNFGILNGTMNPGTYENTGLVAGSSAGTISNVYAIGVSTPDTFAGGFIGVNYGTITDCYAKVNVTGGNGYTGGFAGLNNGGTINRSYSVGIVTGTSNVGGFAGYDSSSKVYNSYYDSDVSGLSDTIGGSAPKTTAEMKTMETFSGWSITNVTAKTDAYDDGSYMWNIVNTSSYPFLSGEFSDDQETNFSTKNFTWTNGGDKFVWIRGHQYDDLVNISMNVTGYISGGTYANDVKIYVNNTLSNNLGLVFSGQISLKALNDSSTSKNTTFDKAETNIDYFRVPKTASITSAFMEFSGFGVNWSTSEAMTYAVTGGDSVFKVGADWYVLSANKVFKYDSNWAYIANYSLRADNLNYRDFHWDGSNWWLISSANDAAEKYNSAFVYQSEQHIISGQDGYPVSISWDGTNWWMLGRNSRSVYKYDSSWNYQSESHSLVRANVDGVAGIYWDGTNWWMLGIDYGDPTKYTTYKYYANWTYTGESHLLGDAWTRGVFRGLAWDGSNWHYSGYNEVYKFGIVNPTNPSVEVGIIDGVDEWNYTGILNGTDSPNRTGNINESINTFLSFCTADSDGYCYPPLFMINQEAGVIEVSDISINYTTNPNPVYLDKDLISAYLGNGINYGDVPIKITSTQNGTLKISDLRYDYKGGNDTISIFSFEQGDTSNNETLSVFAYYSNFFKTLPYTWANKLFFMPKTNSSKNVTAYGQTTTKPAYNITTTNYGGDMNLSIKLNESFSCLNITWSNNATKNESNVINTTWQTINSNVEYLNNTKIWFWADFDNCNASDQRVLQPFLQVEGYCSNCRGI